MIGMSNELRSELPQPGCIGTREADLKLKVVTLTRWLKHPELNYPRGMKMWLSSCNQL